MPTPDVANPKAPQSLTSRASRVAADPVSRNMLLAAVILSACIGLLGGAGAAWLIYVHFGPNETVVNQSIGNGGGSGGTVSDLVSKHAGAVVSIVTQPLTSSALVGTAVPVASGVIVSADGLVVSSTTAVSGATRLRIGTTDGHGYDAIVLATDTVHGVVLLRAQAAQGLSFLALSKSAARPGDLAVVIAHPATGNAIAETATVSSIGVAVSVAGAAVSGTTTLQIAPDPALVGAPVLDGSGALNGVIIGGPAGGQTVAAAPLSAIAPLINAASGTTPAPALTFGATSVLLTPAVAAAASLPPGALVISVTPGGPAAAAGLGVGAIVTAVNGTPIDADHPFEPSAFSVTSGIPATLTISVNGTTSSLALPAVAGPG